MKTQNYQFITSLVLAAAALTAPLPSAFADLHTWAGLGITGNWSLPANWAANNPPSAGEAAPVILIFPPGASRLTNTNNLAGLVVDGLSLTGNGYTLHGSGSGTNLTLHDNGVNTIFVNSTGNTLASTLNLTLAGTVQFNISGSLTNSAKLLGSGGFAKNNPGTLTLNSALANVFTGGVTVNDGALNLAAGFPFFGGWIGEVAIPGPLTIGDGTAGYAPAVVLLEPDQIADTASVSLAYNGTLSLNGNNETIGPLTFSSGDTNFNGGKVIGTGTLTITDNVTNSGYGDASIYCPLSLGGQTRTFFCGEAGFRMYGSISDGGGSAGIVKDGPWDLELYGANTYSGETTIKWGEVGVRNNQALGSAAGGTVVQDYGTLRLYGYQVSGESLTVSNAESYAVSYIGTNSWSGPVTLDTGTYIASSVVPPLNGEDQLTISGPIGGPGWLEIYGAGPIILSGATPNSYAGKTWVHGGTLRLSKPPGVLAVPGNLEIGADTAYVPAQVVLNSDNQISAGPVGYVVVSNTGFLNLNNHNQTVPPLFLYDLAKVDTGAGLLTLQGNVTAGGDPVVWYSSISGNLSLGGANRVINMLGTQSWLVISASIRDGAAPAGFTLTGSGTLTLSGSNSFTGLVIVDTAFLYVGNNFALGATNSGVIVTNGSLALVNVNVAGETLTISGSGTYGAGALDALSTNTWSGPVQLVGDTLFDLDHTNGVLTLSGPVSGPGGLEVYGAGNFRFTGTAPNTSTGQLTCNVNLLELAKTNALAVSGPVQVKSGTLRLRAANQIIDTAPVNVAAGALFDLNSFNETIGDLTGHGSINLGAGVFTVGGANPTDSFDGVISGAGGELDKVGPNTLMLSGDNTYTSGTLVKGGKLLVNGSQPASDVYVYSSATIGGTGTIGNLYGNGGTVSPGNSPGKLNCGNVTFNTNTTFFVELNGTNVGTGYDQLNVTGTVILNVGVTLKVSKHFSGAVGDKFVIVNNDLSDFGLGTFTGLPEGAIFTADGTQFSITYQGGSPINDIVLTQLTMPPGPQINTIKQVAGGAMQVLGQGLPGYAYTVQANDDLNTSNWVTLTVIVTDPNTGAFAFYDFDAPNHAKRFYRLLAQ
jgi:fibronectin-binding autotransporter adhesin